MLGIQNNSFRNENKVEKLLRNLQKALQNVPCIKMYQGISESIETEMKKIIY